MVYKTLQNSIFSVFTLLLVLSSGIGHSQTKASAEVTLQGMGATTADLPFWMQHNTRGRISEGANFMTLARGKVLHQLGSTSFLETGGGAFFEDDRGQVLLDELYLQFRNSWLKAVVGKKQRQELFYGLSATNEGILRSLNVRPLPGVELRTVRPIIVVPQVGLGFEASWAEYQLEEERFASNARLHHKSFHLVVQPWEHFQLKAGLQHYVQWGGNSALFGKQPSGFDDYLRILTGSSGGETARGSDQLNALGNNIGSYEASLTSRLGQYGFSLIYNTLFEDGSGMRLGNTPDGRYGIFVEDLERKGWLHALMYEFYYTKHQSHTTTGPHKYDNYFHNGGYQSGWTYHGRIIGVPFFLPNKSGIGIENNIFTAHHLGFSGLVAKKLPFRFLTSYRRNYGISNTKYSYFTKDPAQEIFSSLFELQVPLEHLQLKLQLGSDFANDAGPNFGAGVGVSYGL